jgi:hypothetical protein
VFEDEIACGGGQDKWTGGAEGYKKICVGLLQMWKTSAVSVFGKR